MNQQQELDFFKFLSTPEGRAAVLSMAKQYQQQYGKIWLARIKKDYPPLVAVVDLVANYDPEPAIDKLKELVNQKIDALFTGILNNGAAKIAVAYTLDSNRAQLLDFHSQLREEIDRPQF